MYTKGTFQSTPLRKIYTSTDTVKHQYSPSTATVQPQYSHSSPITDTVQPHYRQNTVPIQSQYSNSRVPLQTKYSPSTVPLQTKYSHSTATVQSQYNTNCPEHFACVSHFVRTTTSDLKNVITLCISLYTFQVTINITGARQEKLKFEMSTITANYNIGLKNILYIEN